MKATNIKIDADVALEKKEKKAVMAKVTGVVRKAYFTPRMVGDIIRIINCKRCMHQLFYGITLIGRIRAV